MYAYAASSPGSASAAGHGKLRDDAARLACEQPVDGRRGVRVRHQRQASCGIRREDAIASAPPARTARTHRRRPSASAAIAIRREHRQEHQDEDARAARARAGRDRPARARRETVDVAAEAERHLERGREQQQVDDRAARRCCGAAGRRSPGTTGIVPGNRRRSGPPRRPRRLPVQPVARRRRQIARGPRAEGRDFVVGPIADAIVDAQVGDRVDGADGRRQHRAGGERQQRSWQRHLAIPSSARRARRAPISVARKMP